MMRNKKLHLYCFSPPVMLATFIIEVGLIVWTLWRYRADVLVKTVVAILALLAVFQFAEYNVCQGAMGLDSLAWSRIGYVAITFLPVLGIQALLQVANKRNTTLVLALYSIAILFAGYFLTVGHGLTASVCTGNYVIFEVNQHINVLYMLYYYGLEIFTVLLALRFIKTVKDVQKKRALAGIVFGYLCLLVPTTTVNMLNPETLRGVPSIMCGFAVLLAITMVVFVLPPIAKKRKAK